MPKEVIDKSNTLTPCSKDKAVIQQTECSEKVHLLLVDPKMDLLFDSLS